MVYLKNRKPTIIMGALTALVIVFSQLFYYQGADFCQKEIKTEKQDKQDKQDKKTSQQDTYISIPSSSVLSTVHFDLNIKVILLFEIVFDSPAQASVPAEITVSLGKYFHTLFHIIISPNAP